MKKITLSGRLALIFACFLWAISFVATKVALTSAPPLTVVSLRLLISAGCFSAWLLLARRHWYCFDRRWLGKIFVLSLFGTGLHYGTQTIGIGLTSAANASLFAATGPISIVIISWLVLREKLRPVKLMGIFIALTGVLVVMGWGMLKKVQWLDHVYGDLLVIISLFLWGLFTVFGKKWAADLRALDMTAAVTILGSLYMIPFAWVETRIKGFSLAAISPKAWGAIAFLGITCSFLATLLYFFALEKSESQKVGIYLYTIPPMTYLFAAAYLNEPIGLNLLLGSVIVLLGVFLTEKG